MNTILSQKEKWKKCRTRRIDAPTFGWFFFHACSACSKALVNKNRHIAHNRFMWEWFYWKNKKRNNLFFVFVLYCKGSSYFFDLGVFFDFNRTRVFFSQFRYRFSYGCQLAVDDDDVRLEMNLLTFWLWGRGRRHFILCADADQFQLFRPQNYSSIGSSTNNWMSRSPTNKDGRTWSTQECINRKCTGIEAQKWNRSGFHDKKSSIERRTIWFAVLFSYL